MPGTETKKHHYFEAHKRSLAKTITYRIIIIIADAIVLFAVTRRVDFTLGVIFASNISSTILYFLHERAWDKITWGRRKK